VGFGVRREVVSSLRSTSCTTDKRLTAALKLSVRGIETTVLLTADLSSLTTSVASEITRAILSEENGLGRS
jgi:GMP synthase PP-ATPase subunit